MFVYLSAYLSATFSSAARGLGWGASIIIIIELQNLPGRWAVGYPRVCPRMAFYIYKEGDKSRSMGLKLGWSALDIEWNNYCGHNFASIHTYVRMNYFVCRAQRNLT